MRYLGPMKRSATFGRVCSRARGRPAIKHSILCACWQMLTTGELYRDLGGDYFSRQDPERATRRLVAQLERLGHTVKLEAAA